MSFKSLLFGIASGTILQTVLAQTPTITTSSSLSSANATSTQSYHTLFSIPASADNGQPILPNIYDPKAVNAQDVCPGYTASGVQRNAYGFTASLTLAGKACNVYGTDIENLNMSVQYQSGDRLNVDIVPANVDSSNTSHYYTPSSLINKPGLDADANMIVPTSDLGFVWGNQPSFWFSVIRKSMGEILFSTQGNKLVFEDQFVEFKAPLPEDYNLYGLGETIHALRLSNNFTKTMYASDNADTIDRNIYGSHPIYYDTRYYETDSSGNMSYIPWNQTTTDGNYTSQTHGLYYRNPRAHEILLKPEGITWRTLGGNIELYFYAGPTIEEVAKSYQMSTVGLPAMQQYFTFGYHQCRWGYTNWSIVEEVVNNFEKFEIPLENIWTDIDYMSQFRDFTTSSERYPQDEGASFLQRLHNSGRHYIPITDSALYIPNPMNASDAYETFTRGNESNAFMLNPDGSLYIGAVWPGYTVFPDWLGEGAGNWWTNEMTMFHKNLSFDGIWIDMSEVSSFCVGSCGTGNLTLNPAPGGISDTPPYGYPEGFGLTNKSEAASASSKSASVAATSTSSSMPTSYLRTTPTPGVRNINYPPYAINNYAGDLAVHAASPNATHHDELKTQEYDVHNLFGLGILEATYNALLNVFPGKRPFIIGRSTFSGAGHVAGHWGGDNTSKWLYMYFAIPQALSMSLFGIPMFGVDTCGFNENTDEELCNRWMQLSAFFPFYRNHNTIYAISQEPYVWASVTSATKSAIQIRYSILPYIYTLFQTAHTTGSTVMRGLSWEFPNEPLLADADRQFFLGPAILITPVLTQGATTVNGVFPGAAAGTTYYDWYNQSSISNELALSGANITIDAPLGHIPVYVRGGNVLPLQPPQDALVLRDARQKPWSVLVALDREGSASGSLYLDDGASIVPNTQLNVDFAVTNGTLYVNGRGTYEDNNALQNVTVMGVRENVSNVQFKGEKVGNFSYNAGKQLLTVMGLEDMTKSGAWTSDWTLSWM